jgi:voltage-gated sodium channel
VRTEPGASAVGAAETPRSGLLGKLEWLVDHPRFERFIITVIALNAITLGLETSKWVMARWGELLHVLDQIFLAIFVVEIVARLIVRGRKFWTDPWSLFDLSVVVVTLLPASGNLSILRSLRILRALRLISAIPSMRRVVASLLSAIPSMGTIILLMALIVYIHAVMATKLFGDDFEEHFGSIGASAYTFFQIMTLDSWSSSIVRPVLAKYPMAWIFFIPFVILTTFMVLNLFIGIVVDAMQQQSLADREAVIEMTESEYRSLMRELATVRRELRALEGGKTLPPLEEAGRADPRDPRDPRGDEKPPRSPPS